MRNLFFALVLANFAFAAYSNWIADDSAGRPRAGGRAPSLVLASEFEVAKGAPATGRDVEDTSGTAVAEAPPEAPAPEISSEELAASSVADAGQGPTLEPGAPVTTPENAPAGDDSGPSAASAASCVSVGPFRELSQAATAAANLRAAGLDPSQRAGEGEIWVGYWVYLSQIPSVEAAQGILENLRENGITDSYVIPRSESGTLISLGVFTEIARASNRRAAVGELGYEATISDRTRRATVYWIDVMLADDEQLDFEALQPPGRIVRLKMQSCADAAL